MSQGKSIPIPLRKEIKYFEQNGENYNIQELESSLTSSELIKGQTIQNSRANRLT